MKKTALIFAAAYLFGVTAQASEVTITAAPPELAGQTYTLRLYGSDGGVMRYDQAVSAADGVSFTFDLGAKSGSYPYIIVSETGEWSKEGSLAFVNEDELELAKKRLAEALAIENADEKCAAVKKVLTDYYNEFKLGENFAIDEKISKLDTAAAYKRISEQLTDADSAAKIYRTQMLLCAAEKGTAELIAEIDADYLAHLGDVPELISAAYAAMDGSARLDAAKLEKGAYDTAQAYLAAHNKAVALANANTCSSWQSLGETLKKFDSVSGLGFSGISNENTVLQKLAAKLPFASVADYEQKLTAAKSEAASSPTHASTSTGGGGGGGGSSFSGGAGTASPGTDTPGYVSKFTDMENYAWAKEAVDYLAKNGAISGRTETEFAPGEHIKREEFVKILAAAFKLPQSASAEFSDVAPDSWYASYVGAAYAAGVASGMNDGSFGVGQYITRQDAAAMIARACAYTARVLTPQTPAFTDSADISEYAADAVGALAAAGAISGTPEGAFMPQNPITRAETARIIYAAIGI